MTTTSRRGRVTRDPAQPPPLTGVMMTDQGYPRPDTLTSFVEVRPNCWIRSKGVSWS